MNKTKLPTINVLTALSNEGTSIWAIGIDETSTDVQVYIPNQYFSEAEKSKFNADQVNGLAQDRSIYIGESDAYHFVKKYDLFEIKIVSVPFDISQAV